MSKTSAGAAETSTPAAFKELARSEEHTSELQSLFGISYAVFCLKKKGYYNRAPRPVDALAADAAARVTRAPRCWCGTLQLRSRGPRAPHPLAGFFFFFTTAPPRHYPPPPPPASLEG